MARRQRSIPDLAGKIGRLLELRASQLSLDITNGGLATELQKRDVQVGEDTLRQIRSGYNANPGTDILVALSDLLQAPVAYWFVPAVEERVLSESEAGPLRPGQTAQLISRIESLPPTDLAALLNDLD